MKVYTTTLYRNNYGSALQAYALQCKIRELGGIPIIVERPRENNKLTIFQRIICFFRPEKHYGLIKKFQRFFQKKKLTEKKKKIDAFVRDNITVESFNNVMDSFKQEPCIFLTGSDQVWSIINRPIDDYYLFKSFPQTQDVIKYSYAASIGLSDLSVKQIDYYRAELQCFDVLSLRERVAYDIFKNSFPDKVVRNDLDPTLLYGESFWSKIAAQRVVSEPYILVYMLRPDNSLIKMARHISKQNNNCKIIYTGLYANNYVGIETISNAGVEEFLSLIKYANVVITNSFHGTAFSVTFKRNFLSVRIKSTSSRVENLLDIVGLKNRLIDSVEQAKVLQEDIDYHKVEDLLSKERNKSIEYLKTILNEGQ